MLQKTLVLWTQCQRNSCRCELNSKLLVPCIAWNCCLAVPYNPSMVLVCNIGSFGSMKVQLMVDFIMWLWKLVVCMPTNSDDASSWTNMLYNDGQQDSCSMIWYCNHHAQAGLLLNHPENPMALTKGSAVILPMHELACSHLSPQFNQVHPSPQDGPASTDIRAHSLITALKCL